MTRIRILTAGVAAAVLILGPGLSARASQADPFIAGPIEEAAPAATSAAWYWEPQFSQTVTDPTTGADLTVIELPNPWCPVVPLAGPPPSNCYSGRLPIEVQNDYKAPDKLSAVGFDLSLVPIGSDVKKFTVVFREADLTENQPSFNHEAQTLMACEAKDFFGDGAARQYEELPKHECSDASPKGTRVETEDGAFGWEFDLTDLAQHWVDDTTPVTGIIIYPVKPAEETSPLDNIWRVVLAGLEVENGVVTSLRYKPASIDDGGTGTDDGFTDSGGFTDTGGGFTDSGGFTDTGTGTPPDISGEGTPPTGETAPSTAPSPASGAPVAIDTDAASSVSQTQQLPWYAWVAILSGLILFSLVRSVVIEKTTGIRPDGVIAQIRRINTGSVATAAASTGGPWQAVGDFGRQMGRKLKLIKR